VAAQFELTKNCNAVLGLNSADPQLAGLIDLIGEFTMPLRTDYFASLVRSIIGQQLSVKAAATIWKRTLQACGEMRPETILALDEEKLRAAGFSMSKITYVRDLAGRVLSGELDLERLSEMPDDEIIGALTKVKGIGVWTAQMFLIFSLGRPDVLSTADLGLRRALGWLYQLDETPGAKDFEQYGEKWQPYRTTASLYLWEAINRGHLR